ncbi:MAG: enoyl-CoA hydratase/isomerase family protein [Gammaproteobacteria bacterium]
MIQGSYQGFDVEIRGSGVAVVTFNKPERLNAMSFGARRDLCEVLTLAQFDDDVRVVVLTGTGRGFIAGVSNASTAGRDDGPENPTLVQPKPARRDGMSEQMAESGHFQPVNLYSQLVHFAQEPVRTLRRLDKLTIAAVNGFAIQLGLTIALACDFAISARSAKLGSATLRMGWQPDEGGHWLLVQHLGVKRAMDFLMNQRIVTAEQALGLGLVNEVVDDDALLPRALEMAEQLANGPQAAMRVLKKAVYNAAQMTFEQAGDDIASKTAVTDHHPDAKEGSAAFFRKEKPRFNKWLEK